MVEIKKATAEISKKELMKLSDNRPTGVKAMLEEAGEIIIANPRYAAFCHVTPEKGKNGSQKDPFDIYVFCDDQGILYSAGDIAGARKGYEYIEAMKAEAEPYALRFTSRKSGTSGRNYVSCELL